MVPFGLRVATAFAWRFLVVGTAVVVLGIILARIRVVAVAVAAAILLAALLQPGVAWLRVRRVPRGLAVLACVLGFFAVVGTTFWLIGSQLVAQAPELQAALTGGIDQVRNALVNSSLPIGRGTIDQVTDQLISGLQRNSNRVYAGVLSTATVAAEVVGGMLLALFTMIFLLLDGRGIWGWIVRLFPQGAAFDVDEAGHRAWHTLVRYVRGTMVVAMFDAAFIGLALVIMGVPLALPLTVLTFFGAFIPIVGATLAGAAAVLVALVDGGLSTALVILAAVVAVQQVEGHLLQPLVLGRAVAVHPVAIALSIAAGGIVAGLAGAVLAVPIAATVNTVGRYLAERHPTQRAALGLPATAPPGSAPDASAPDASAPGGAASAPDEPVQTAEESPVSTGAGPRAGVHQPLR